MGALDPVRARRASPDADTNDLKTINIYTVGVLHYSHRHLVRLCMTLAITRSEMAQVSTWTSFTRLCMGPLIDALPTGG